MCACDASRGELASTAQPPAPQPSALSPSQLDSQPENRKRSVLGLASRWLQQLKRRVSVSVSESGELKMEA